MSWQAGNAVRDHSESRGATRTVALVLASYADQDGGGVYPSLSTIAAGAKVRRHTAAEARRRLIESGEVAVIGWRSSRTGSSTPILSFAPLMMKGTPSGPLNDEGDAERPLKGPVDESKGTLSDVEGVAERTREVSKKSVEKKEEKQRPSSFLPPEQQTAADLHRQQADREDALATLRDLRAQLPTTRHPETTQRSIESIEVELGLISDDPVVAAELDSWTGWVGDQLEAMAVAA